MNPNSHIIKGPFKKKLQPDKRTLKKKTDSTESSSTESTRNIEDTSGDTDLEGMDETDENDGMFKNIVHDMSAF